MKRAFTLTETLTVLMVIGVVALMTIPTLISSTNEQKSLSMLKKLYSSYCVNIQQVLTRMDRDGGYNCSSFSCTRAFNGDPDNGANRHDVTGAAIPPHKHNGILANTSLFNIDNENMGLVRVGEKMPDNDIKVDTDNKKPSVYHLSNGTSAIIYDYNGNCITSINGDFNACGILILDTNGREGGGIPCKDRYAFYIANEQTPSTAQCNAGFPNCDKLKPSYLVPFGYNVTDGDFSGHNNFDCTGEIVMNDWKPVK